jgi:hypothetical protein
MNNLSTFIEKVKEGEKRGDFCIEKTSENLYVEFSVGDFRFGNIHVRIWVEEDIDPQKDMRFRRLHRIDDKYKKIHNEISKLLEQKNETSVSVAFEPSLEDTEIMSKNPELIPDSLETDNAYAFGEFVNLRDDVSMMEAMMTNRDDGMTRKEIEDMLSKDRNS